MNLEEYEKSVKQEEEAHAIRLRDLASKYAFANNPHVIGDIVTDGHQTVEIERIRFSRGFHTPPHCMYTGPMLTKKMVPRKDGMKGTVSQCNIEKSS